MRRRMLVVLCGVAVALSATTLVTAQDQEEQDRNTGPRPIGGLAFVDEVDVTVVNIIAHVTDSKGRPVTDLAREDFRVLQDGQERPVSNFEVFTESVYRSRWWPELPPSGPQPTPAADEGDAEEPDLRPVYMALYVDNENLHPLDRNRVLSQAREFVRSNLRPPVQMMVVSYQKGLKILQPFTTDERLVLGALRDLRRTVGGYPERQAERRDIYDDLQQVLQEEGTRGGYRARQERDYVNFYHRIVAFAEEEQNHIAFTLDALRSAISTLAGLEGKKAIVYISNGLPMVPGIDLIQAFTNIYQDHGILTEISRFDRTSAYKALVSAANAQDVTFYTIGAGGLEITGMAGADRQAPIDPLAASIGSNNYVDSLRYMAEGTGGLAVVNTNDFGAGLERIEQDMYTYYSLGYPITASGADKVHRIEVELPGHPEYDVRYRRRFVEKSAETRVQDKVYTGLMFDLDENPLQIDFTAGEPAPATGDRWSVPVHISFPIDTVALLPQGEDYVGRLVLFVAARDAKGKQSDMVRQEHEVRVPAADYEEALSKRFGIYSSLLMEPGSYRVSVGVMDQITRQASYQTLRTSVRE